MAPDFVSHLLAWEPIARTRATGLGIELKFDNSPPDGRSKSAAWVIAERADRSAELIVWSSGEVELVAGNATGGELLQEHRDISTLGELDGLLAALLSHV
jgi:hypothetical protein